jgi:glycosyltransferase involved in cell wall biosynthesis
MIPVTTVIICKNEVAAIEETIVKALKLSPHVIAVDSGSTDGTLAILERLGVTIVNTTWQGFGPTKNIGIQHATTDWILSIDADEHIDNELIRAIQSIDFSKATIIYSIKCLNYLGNTPLKYGEWGADKHKRLFNKKIAGWNDTIVHETIVSTTHYTVKQLEGFIHHKTAENKMELKTKLEKYAHLNAQYYFTSGKKNGYFKLLFSPAFNFVVNYIFRLGFMDGRAGFIVAKENAIYTYKKYLYLQQMIQKKSD